MRDAPQPAAALEVLSRDVMGLIARSEAEAVRSLTGLTNQPVAVTMTVDAVSNDADAAPY